MKHILGDSQVKALQSDGYNVYMYLNDRMADIEHLCCMAHARAKFKYALEQGNDKGGIHIGVDREGPELYEYFLDPAVCLLE